MNDVVSDCFEQFGHEDFDIDRVRSINWAECPVNGCTSKLARVEYRKSTKPFCPRHGLRLHSRTFVYWNGESQREEASLRNFRIRPNLARRTVFSGTGKVESHRLGYEMSEDALSWNVFVALAEAGKLRDAVQLLTGRKVDSDPRLYLWGKLVSFDEGRSDRFKPLQATRLRLERGIGTYKTEPDIMLVVDGQLLVLIEAKFGSGNPLASDVVVKPGQKPISREGLFARYFSHATPVTQSIISKDRVGKEFHSQIFRNIVFASEMANGSDWSVVNLVSGTQWNSGKETKGYSSSNPEETVRSYLADTHQECFHFRTWEGLHRTLIANNPELRELDSYLRTKSAHFAPAFDLQ